MCQYNVRVAIRLCACLAARTRSPETVSNHLPPFLSHRTSTLRNVRLSRTGAVLRVPHVHVHLNLTHGVLQHSVRLPQKLALRFVQEHVATFHCVVTCLKVKFRHHFTRALRYLCDDVSSWSCDQTGKKPHKITTSNGVAQLHNGKQAHVLCEFRSGGLRHMSYRKKLKRRENFAAILVTSNNCAPQPSKCQ